MFSLKNHQRTLEIFLVMGFLPMVILSILNWLIYRAITRARALHATLKSGNSHRRDNTMVTVLTAIVFVFVICHSPKAALNIYEVGTVRKDKTQPHFQSTVCNLINRMNFRNSSLVYYHSKRIL